MNSRKLFAIVPIMMVLARGALTLSLEAQEPAATPPAAPVQPPIVRVIELQCEGLSAAKEKELLAGIRKIRIGKPYSEQAMEEDMRHICHEAGLTLGGRVFGEPVPGGVKVIFVVRAVK